MQTHPLLKERGDLLDGALGPLETEDDVELVVWSLLVAQAELARETAAPAATLRKGNEATKSAFYTLLARRQQAALFERFSEVDSWLPSMQSLFGNPPYSFLGCSDEYGLQATGINHTRSSILYVDPVVMPHYQFGAAHFVDGLGVEYRVVDDMDEPPAQGRRTAVGPRLLLESRRLSLVARRPHGGAWEDHPLSLHGATVELSQPVRSALQWRCTHVVRARVRIDELSASHKHVRTCILTVSVLSAEERALADARAQEDAGAKRSRGGK